MYLIAYVLVMMLLVLHNMILMVLLRSFTTLVCLVLLRNTLTAPLSSASLGL